jgi:type I restriction-modification system DNA methylase subunit
MNMILHDDGHTNVIAADGLVSDSEARDRTRNLGFTYGRFDFIVTNPPFGSTVKQTEKAYLHQYRLATREVDWLNPKSKAAERPGQDTEILFIEQNWHYLTEGGYLAIVIPDGILTNSSLQYVRDEIEDLFRIAAVVSLPQTAFTATGAGVKSSVLFLKKHTENETRRLRNLKQALKDNIRKQQKFEATLDAIEQEKKEAIVALHRRPEFAERTAKERAADPVYENLAKEVSQSFTLKIDELRQQLAQLFVERRRKELPDYDIFMAIAEDIGYDATGRPTNTNELDPIAKELSTFLQAIEDGAA